MNNFEKKIIKKQDSYATVQFNMFGLPAIWNGMGETIIYRQLFKIVEIPLIYEHLF